MQEFKENGKLNVLSFLYRRKDLTRGMVEKIKKLFRMLCTPEMLSYIAFGIGTTVVNILVFRICTAVLLWDWALSNTVAWVLSVLFAFVTNKLFVFHSKDGGMKRLLWETLTFFGARVLSLGIDMAGMWLLIDVIHMESFIAKIIMNVIVIVVNYALSKCIIFRKDKTEG